MDTTLIPGAVLVDRYRLAHRIATGGMGQVWAADDIRLARPVAIKILRPELTDDPQFVDRFRTEARITASLSHPGIAAVHDYGELAPHPGQSRGMAFLVMELVDGQALSTILARTPRLPPAQVLDILIQSAHALQVPHGRGLVHRDIKPGNILITGSGQVKITDFGVATAVHQQPLTRAGMVLGTAQYLAPEQAAGAAAVPASDVYALGVVAFEASAGYRPFDGPNPTDIAAAQVRQPPPPLPPDVPGPLATLVAQMLVKDPRHRFPHGAALAQAADACRAAIRVPPPPPRTPPTPAPGPGTVPGAAPRQGRRWWTALAVTVATLTTVTVMALTMRPAWLGGRTDATNRDLTRPAGGPPVLVPVRSDTCDNGRSVTAEWTGGAATGRTVAPHTESECRMRVVRR